MDFKSPRYFHSHTNSSSTFSSLVNGEPPLKSTAQKNDPFAETLFQDPLCKLNLKETSEFVKSFPRRSEGSTSSGSEKRLVVAEPAPATPGRPVFGFSPSGSYPGNNRKSFPSKWDDAEKWLVSCSSCHDSPAHHSDHSLRPSNNGGNYNNINNVNVFKQQMEAFSDKSRVTLQEEKVSSKAVVPNFHHHNSSVRGFNGVLGSADHVLFLKDKFTDEIQQQKNSLAISSSSTKETFLFKNEASMRDAGTEMTPVGSTCHTPVKAYSPARHNTPLDRSGPLGPPPCAAHLEDIARLAKLQLYDSNWSSREEEEEEVSKSLRHFDIIDNACHNTFISANNNVVNAGNESRAARWEEEDKAKCCSRYQREEAKIQAWVNLQSAKAEAQSRKLEVKIQKMRSNLEEKLLKRMAIVHRKAEELRESARKQHSDQMQKATQNSNKKLNCNNMNYHHSHFSTYTTTSCGCFPCSNSIHYI